MKVQCAFCINEPVMISQIERLVDELGIPGEFNMVYMAMQTCVQKYGCPDFFPVFFA